MAEVDAGGLERALGKLKTSLAYCGSEEASANGELFEVFRSAAIQGFEFTYELSHKLLRRYLASISASPPTINAMPFADLVRTAHGQSIVSRDWRQWHEFRRLRSLTSHTYAESCAAEVFQAIPVFVDEMEKMLAAMRAGGAS